MKPISTSLLFSGLGCAEAKVERESDFRVRSVLAACAVVEGDLELEFGPPCNVQQQIARAMIDFFRPLPVGKNRKPSTAHAYERDALIRKHLLKWVT